MKRKRQSQVLLLAKNGFFYDFLLVFIADGFLFALFNILAVVHYTKIEIGRQMGLMKKLSLVFVP